YPTLFRSAALRRGLREEAEQELKGAAGLVRAMGEVAVVARPDREDAQHVQRRAQDHGLQRDAGPERGEARQMDQQERNGGGIDDVVGVIVPDRGARVGRIVRARHGRRILQWRRHRKVVRPPAISQRNEPLPARFAPPDPLPERAFPLPEPESYACIPARATATGCGPVVVAYSAPPSDDPPPAPPEPAPCPPVLPLA